MVFIDTTNHFYNKLNSHILSLNEIEEYIFNLINNLGIDEYVLGVDFIEGDNLGSYSFETNMIKLNVPLLIEEAKKLYTINNIDKDLILFINLNILEAVLHEVMHGIQNCNLNETDFAYNILYARELAYKDKLSDELYDKYYYLFSYERDAIISSIENILPIIKSHYKEDERIFTYFLSNLYKFLTLGYTIDFYHIKSPAEKVCEELYHENTPILSNIDTYDRLKLGYQITPKKFRSFRRNKVRKILVKNDLL